MKNSEENNNLTNNKVIFGPHIPSKMNRVYMENKINNNEILENIKKNLNNNMSINNNKNIKISDIHKNKMKSSERIKRNFNFNLHLNNISNVNQRKNTGNMTNTINTYIPGKLTLSLSSENKMNRKNKISKNSKYNYEYNYNFNSSPKKHLLTNNSPVETLNTSNELKPKLS